MAMIGPEFPVVLGAAARGDEEAFGRLWRDLQPRLLRYFAVVSRTAAEDLASETCHPGHRRRPGAAGLHRGGPATGAGQATSRRWWRPTRLAPRRLHQPWDG
jgi:hypothetical protein